MYDVIIVSCIVYADYVCVCVCVCVCVRACVRACVRVCVCEPQLNLCFICVLNKSFAVISFICIYCIFLCMY